VRKLLNMQIKPVQRPTSGVKTALDSTVWS